MNGSIHALTDLMGVGQIEFKNKALPIIKNFGKALLSGN